MKNSNYTGIMIKIVSVRDAVIEDMISSGIDIASFKIIEKVELKDISVCNSGEADIAVYGIGPTGIQEVKTGGDVQCDSAEDRAAAERDISDKYCTASCPLLV